MTSIIKPFWMAAVLLSAIGLASAARADVPEKKKLPLMVPHELFPKDCGQCHVSTSWDVMSPNFKFDHAKTTGYPLNGAHAQIKCVECHNDRGPVKIYIAHGCGGCHPDPHQHSLAPDCQKCHNEITWRPINMIAEHAKTAFPLTGAHLALQCVQCHVQIPKFPRAQTQCISCHLADYKRAPNHVKCGLSTQCLSCHPTSAWPIPQPAPSCP